MSSQPAPAEPSSAEDRVGDITTLLGRWGEGDPELRERLVCLLYPELKRIARAHMRHERAHHTLQVTDLVNEFYLALLRHPAFHFESRTHFLLCASKAMRRLLVDHARARRARKRGAGAAKVAIEEVNLPYTDDAFDLVEFDELLRQVAEHDPRMAQVVELKFFGGLTNAEAGEVLGVHERTVKRDWQFARAWLLGRMQEGKTDGSMEGLGPDQAPV